MHWSPYMYMCMSYVCMEPSVYCSPYMHLGFNHLLYLLG